MSDASGVVRRIAWRELFPWLLIFRTFRLSIAPTMLLVASLGVIVEPLGRTLGSYIFLNAPEREAMRFVAYRLPFPATPGQSLNVQQSLESEMPAAINNYLPHTPTGVREAFFYYAEPVWRLFHLQLPLRHVAFYVFVSLWMLAVWAFCGAVIVRRAVVLLSLDQDTSLREAATFAARRYLYYFLAPLYPLLGVLLLALPMALIGMLMRLNAGVVVAGIIWIVAVLLGLVAAWLLAGLLLGWPLMWGAISAEREGDAFEAFSRSYSYVYARPLHYFFYVVVAAVFGALCWAVVNYAAQMIIEFGFWSASWGAGGQRMAAIRELALSTNVDGVTGSSSSLRTGASLIGCWLWLVGVVRTAFIFSFFWTVAAAIYLLLRQATDDKEIDDVYQLEDEHRFDAARRAIAAAPLSAAADDAPGSADTAE